MATTKIINRAESWDVLYTAIQTINFTSFDYSTIKQSLITYVQTYFPEDFNDYIESSEFIALVEAFAYIGELMAYRLDVNAHENFITTAQRKESILRLAKLISYSPTRNLPNRGLVKITSITTTEHVYDTDGNDLSNVQIYWNDPNNSIWKEQFLLILNRALSQPYGTVSPNERIQVEDVLFELYTLDNNPLNNGVFPYRVSVSGETLPMELVSASLDTNGPYERRPDVNAAFSLLYGSDGLGDGSDTTGFFMYTKQGTLQQIVTTFDGVTPNQTYDIQISNINDTDLWVNNIDPVTYAILDDGSSTSGPSGAWQEVDLAHAQNIIFNTNPNRNKYEVESLDNDQVRLVFGDGEFANIPNGTFQLWLRTSYDKTLVVPKSNVANLTASFTYQDVSGSVQTLSFTFSLINSLQNNSPSEDIEHIRSVAPSVYYSQDRMVNGRDYNTFMLQDPSILKLKAVNRTFAGDSKYIAWHDPRETYEDVKLFGNDLALYFEDTTVETTVTGVTSASLLISNYIEPILSSTDFFTIFTSRGILPTDVRRTFTSTELTSIEAVITSATPPPATVQIYYGLASPTDTLTNGVWQAVLGTTAPTVYSPLWSSTEGMITVTANTTSNWTITHRSERLVANSQNTRFWNTNDASRIIAYDTLNSDYDQIVVLKANTNDAETTVLSQNWNYNVLGQITQNGLPDYNVLSVLPQDTNGDGIPDNVDLAEIIDPVYSVYDSSSLPLQIQLPFVALHDDISNDVSSSADIEYSYHNYSSLVALPKPNAQVATTGTNITLSGGTPSTVDGITLSITTTAVVTGSLAALDLAANTSTLHVTAITSGTIAPGNALTGTGITTGTTVLTNGTDVSGYQIVDTGGSHTGTDVTGLTNDATVYTATITIDGTGYPVSATGSANQTYTDLLATINTAITSPTNGTADLNTNGNIQVTSASTGFTSTVSITDVDLFSTLTGFVAIDTAIQGGTDYTVAEYQTAASTTITASQGDRILVKDQTDATQNGLYQVTILGTGADGTWSRASDFLTGAVVSGALVYVEEGTLYGTTEWILPTSTSLIVDTDTLTFTEVVDPLKVDEIQILDMGTNTQVDVTVKEYVYFSRTTTIDDWIPQTSPTSADESSILSYLADPNRDNAISGLWKREHGRYPLNFAWFHFTPNYHLIDPSATNIIDTFIVTNGYYSSLRSWLDGKTTTAPSLPTPLELRTDYADLLDSKMISDTVILHPGKFKLLFGSEADQRLQATFAVVRNPLGSLTDNQVKVKIVSSIKNFFDINNWDFGETFYFTELAAQIHIDLSTEIETVVLVPTYSQNHFGDLFEVYAREDEILFPSISVSDISIVTSLNPQTIRQNI